MEQLRSYLVLALPLVLLAALILVRRFFKTVSPRNLTIEQVRKQERILGTAAYGKYLKRIAGSTEAVVIADAERGLPRNRALEELVRFIDSERQRLNL